MNLPIFGRAAAAGGSSLSLPGIKGHHLGLGLLLVTMLALSMFRGSDPDYWWHLKTGELIVETKSVPTEDVFAFTTEGKEWVDHEWLSQVLIYGLHETVGYAGEVLVLVAIGLAAIMLMYRLALSMEAPTRIAVGLTIWSAIMSISFWSVRPATFSLLLTALFLSAAWQYRRGKRSQMWHLPLLMVLWCNLHGGYIFGLGVLGLLGMVELWETYKGRLEPQRLVHVALVGVACFLASGLNPYTWKMWVYPFTYFVGDNASMQFISEWQSPTFFHGVDNFPFAVSVVALVAFGVSSGRFDIWRAAVGVVFTVLALQSVRSEGIYALVFIPVMAEVLRDRFPASNPFAEPKPQTRFAPQVNLLALVVWSIACAALLLTSDAQTGRNARAECGLVKFPAEGAAYIRDNYPDDRMFNDYNWGGYLINELYPEQKVLIDGRADLHLGFLTEYQDAVRLKPGWQDFFIRFDIHVTLIPKDSALASILRLDPNWREEFTGDVESVFVSTWDRPPL